MSDVKTRCCAAVVVVLSATQATSALLLPRPLELSTEGLEEPPALVDDVDDYDPEVCGVIRVCVCVTTYDADDINLQELRCVVTSRSVTQLTAYPVSLSRRHPCCVEPLGSGDERPQQRRFLQRLPGTHAGTPRQPYCSSQQRNINMLTTLLLLLLLP